MPGLTTTLELAGAFVFGLSGASAAVRRRLDFFGVLVVAAVAGNAGGVLRDLLVGEVPPAALRDGRHMGVAALAGLLAFSWPRAVERLRSPVLIFDAGGLALFAVSGTHRALEHGIGPGVAPLLGMLTGVGGGVARDLLLVEIPVILREDLYAVAALAGAAAVVAGRLLGLPPAAGTATGVALCVALRFGAIRRGWRLPLAGEAVVRAPRGSRRE